MQQQIDKAMELIMTILTQVIPPMVAKIESIQEHIGVANTRIEELIKYVNELPSSPAPVPVEKKRTQMIYPTYVKVKELSDAGYLDKEIGTELRIPYTTIRSYLRWTDKQVAKKKQEWDAKQAGKKYVEPNEPTLPEVYTITEEDKQSYVPVPMEDEYEQIETMLPTATTFNEWTLEDRRANDENPDHLPVAKDMIVVAQRNGNAYTMPYAVRQIDWSTLGEVTGWRHATEYEQGQYIARHVGLL